MEKPMPTGTFRLKGANLVKIARDRGVDNVHQIALNSGVTYQTVHKYATKPEDTPSVHLKTLYGIIVDGMNMSAEELQDLKFVDVFEAIPDSAE